MQFGNEVLNENTSTGIKSSINFIVGNMNMQIWLFLI